MLRLGDKVRLNSAYAYYVNKQHLNGAVGRVKEIHRGGEIEVEWEGVWFDMEDYWYENELVLIEDTEVVATTNKKECAKIKTESAAFNGSKCVQKGRLNTLICFGLMMLSLAALLAVSFGLTYLITASAASFVFMSSQFDLTQWDTIARVAFLPLWVVVVVSAITFSLQEG